MKYEVFDTLNNGITRNAILLLLNVEALTSEDIGKVLNLERTSVHYHMKKLLEEDIITKVKVKKYVYFGINKNIRMKNKVG